MWNMFELNNKDTELDAGITDTGGDTDRSA